MPIPTPEPAEDPKPAKDETKPNKSKDLAAAAKAAAGSADDKGDDLSSSPIGAVSGGDV